MASTKPADQSANEQKSAEQPSTIACTVAPGRTIDGKGPGTIVELDLDDAVRFLKLGFILDEDGAQRFPSDGPAVNVEDGVQIKPAS